MESIERQFVEFEDEVFGFGYGSGEDHVIPALHTFMQHCYQKEGTYDYRQLEELLGGATAWLLINVLCNHGMIEYGTSPRFGWIDHDPDKERLAKFIATTEPDTLVDLIDRKYGEDDNGPA